MTIKKRQHEETYANISLYAYISEYHNCIHVWIYLAQETHGVEIPFS